METGYFPFLRFVWWIVDYLHYLSGLLGLVSNWGLGLRNDWDVVMGRALALGFLLSPLCLVWRFVSWVCVLGPYAYFLGISSTNHSFRRQSFVLLLKISLGGLSYFS